MDDLVIQHYLASPDFNGLPLGNLTLGMSESRGRQRIAAMIRARKIDIVFTDNPHIKRLESVGPAQQIAELKAARLSDACAYPTPDVLLLHVPASSLVDRPFSRRLALGAPQLRWAVFDLAVLEQYRNDPRYSYWTNDIGGQISTGSVERGAMPSSDQVFLESFGFCYDHRKSRHVAVYLRYLNRLSPEHQQIWRAREADVETKLHPGYWRETIGDWNVGISVFSALLRELAEVNRLCSAIGWEPLFRNTWTEDNRPKEFGALVRPTRKEFNDFVHVLDKMLSDNINAKFFKGKVVLFRTKMVDGQVEREQKGTIQLLEEWLSSRFQASDSAVPQMFVALRAVRKARQAPAHQIEDNHFDQEFVRNQQDLIQQAYAALGTLRKVLQKHPRVKAAGYVVPAELDGETVWLE